MEDLIQRVNTNTTGIFRRDSELIVILPSIISNVIGDNRIYLSEFIIAKIKGKINEYFGHPNITDEILIKIPMSLLNPVEILRDVRRNDRKEYIFINIDPLHQIIVEVERRINGLTEINTVFDTTLSELKRLEGKLPVVYSSGETPSSRIHASP